jgi:hypothetical protein
LRGEISIDSPRAHPAVALRGDFQPFERRLELLAHRLLEALARPARAPLQSIELIQIEQREDFVDGDVLEHPDTPERRCRHRMVLRHVAARAGGVPDRDVLSRPRVQVDVVARLLDHLRHERRPSLAVLELVHRLQPLERVLTIEDTGRVRPLAVDE